METYIKLLLWILSGLVFGSLIYYALLQPAVVPTQPAYNTTPQLQNGSPLPQNNSSPINLTPPVETENVSFILIRAPNCDNCTNGDTLAAQSLTIFNETGQFTVTGMDTPDSSSVEAKALISKYNITRLPVLIILGNTSAVPSLVSSWESSVGSVESDGAMVSRDLPPPYYDIQSGKIV